MNKRFGLKANCGALLVGKLYTKIIRSNFLCKKIVQLIF